ERCEFVGASRQRLGELLETLRSIRRTTTGPAAVVDGPACRLDRRVHVGDRTVGRRRKGLFRRWVDIVEPGVGRSPVPTDEDTVRQQRLIAVGHAPDSTALRI